MICWRIPRAGQVLAIFRVVEQRGHDIRARGADRPPSRTAARCPRRSCMPTSLRKHQHGQHVAGFWLMLAITVSITLCRTAVRVGDHAPRGDHLVGRGRKVRRFGEERARAVDLTAEQGAFFGFGKARILGVHTITAEHLVERGRVKRRMSSRMSSGARCSPNRRTLRNEALDRPAHHLSPRFSARLLGDDLQVSSQALPDW